MVVGVGELIAAIGHVGDFPARAVLQEHLRLGPGVLFALLGGADDAYDVPCAPALVVRLLVLIFVSVLLRFYNQQVGCAESVFGVECAGQASGGARCEEREGDDFVDGLRTARGNDLVQLQEDFRAEM